jgi:DNA (cytosine-5)-methyltransferase 1
MNIGENMLTHFSLFTGIGGIDLAAEWAGFTTVGQCEWADYPTNVLEKHWPDVPRWRDIRNVTAESFKNRTGLSTVDLISGGFPCQPFSVAGKRKGKNDDRYLWPEMFRVIQELRPTWMLGENVPGIVNMALEKVCTDLEDKNYEVQPIIIPACGVGALHRRYRVFILAHSNGAGDRTQEFRLNGNGQTENEGWKEQSQCRTIGLCENVADTNDQRLQRRGGLRERTREWLAWTGSTPLKEIWQFEPNVGRVANGIPNRVDRLKCLGNAVVPQQVYPVLKAIADIENGLA